MYTNDGRSKPLSVKRQLLNTIRLPLRPAKVFAELGQSPSWWVAFISFSLCSMIIGWFMIPAIQQPMRHVFEESFGSSGADAAIAATTRSLLVIGLAFEPAWKIVRWLILSSAIFLLVLPLSAPKRVDFKQVDSFVVYSEVIFILVNSVNLLLIYLKGLDRVESVADLTVIKGLEILVGTDYSNHALGTLLENINIVSIWYLAVISVGIWIITGLRKYEAVFIAATSWLIWTALDMARPYLSQLVMQPFGLGG